MLPVSRSARYAEFSRWIVPGTSFFIIVAFVATALLSSSLAPHSPVEVSLPNRLRPPAWLPGGSNDYLFGTDLLGRDVLSRVVFGAQTSLVVAIQTLVLGAGIGGLVGIIAGFFRGWIDGLLMVVVDMMLSIPLVLLALVFVVVVGPSTGNVIIAMALVLWARFARVVRGEVLGLRERDFVAMARVAGTSDVHIMWRHLLPNVANTLMVLISLQVGWVIIVEASLSFLGAGVPPPTPAWGSMIAEGRNYIESAWWLSVFPGIATMLTVLAFNLFGDWLRDEMDPKLNPL